jgi:hypothetical protein
MDFPRLLKQLNKFEKIYIMIFFGSILAGIVNGAIDENYFVCCEDSIGVPEEGTSALKIFTSNFLLSLTELFTAGISSVYYNFHTFSITSSYLISQDALYMIVIILLVGSLELVGSLIMALAGFGFVERKLFRLRSKLDYKLLFLYGTALIFSGAVLEYVLLKPFI